MPLILLLVAVAVFVKFAWLFGAVLAVVAAGWSVGKWLAFRDDYAQERRRRDAEIVARADCQHAAVLAGDESGVFGEFPPAVRVG